MIVVLFSNVKVPNFLHRLKQLVQLVKFFIELNQLFKNVNKVNVVIVFFAHNGLEEVSAVADFGLETAFKQVNFQTTGEGIVFGDLNNILAFYISAFDVLLFFCLGRLQMRH